MLISNSLQDNTHQRHIRQSKSKLRLISMSSSSSLEISSALSDVNSLSSSTTISTSSSFSTTTTFAATVLSNSTIFSTIKNSQTIPTFFNSESFSTPDSLPTSVSLTEGNNNFLTKTDDKFQFYLILSIAVGGILFILILLITLFVFLRKRNKGKNELFCTESDGSVSRTHSIRLNSANPTKAFSVYEDGSNKDSSSKSGGSFRRHTFKSANSEGILDEWDKSISEDDEKNLIQ
ncbi:hypothetical protein HDU92_000402, partial [Lobulomyces angularis]